MKKRILSIMLTLCMMLVLVPQTVLADLTDNDAPLFLEIKVKKGARADLGRPTTTPVENKEALMDFLKR